jgi:hypothetical protein
LVGVLVKGIYREFHLHITGVIGHFLDVHGEVDSAESTALVGLEMLTAAADAERQPEKHRAAAAAVSPGSSGARPMRASPRC